MPILKAVRKLAHLLQFGSPIRWLTLEQAKTASGVNWHPIAPASPWWPAPQVFGHLAWNIMDMLPPLAPENGVLEIANGAIGDSDGRVFLSDGSLVPVTTIHHEHPNQIKQMRVRRHLIGLKRLRGTTLNLLSEWAYDNFGHFVHECLGKWELFCLAGFDVAQVDHILIHRPLSANAQRLLACSGIPPSKIIWGDGVRGYRCERLLAPVAPGHRGTIDQSTGTALVQRYRPHTAQRTHKRLFIDRIGLQRQLTNIEEIRRLLMAAGYESYMPEQHPDTFIEDFAAAEAVVGIHGAGMGNALYCQPGTPVLEIQSSDHPNLAPMALVSCAGCKVGIIVADAGSTRRPGPTDPIQRSPLNPTLDLAEFSTAAAALNIPIAPR